MEQEKKEIVVEAQPVGLRAFECEHLKSRSKSNKHPVKQDEHESPTQRLICGICNCYWEYDKKVLE